MKRAVAAFAAMLLATLLSGLPVHAALPAPTPGPTSEAPWRMTDDRDLRGLDTVLALGQDDAGLVMVAARAYEDPEELVVLASSDGLDWHVRSRRRMHTAEAGPFAIEGDRIIGFGPGVDQPLLRSGDGGRSWQLSPDRRPLMPGTRAVEDCCPWHFPYGGGVALTRTPRGWLLGGGIWPRFESKGTAALWSSPTGERWHRVPAPRAVTVLGIATDGVTVAAIADGPGRSGRSLWWRSAAGRWSPAVADVGSVLAWQILVLPGLGYLALVEGDLAPIVIDDVISMPVHATTFLTSRDGRSWTRAGMDAPDGDVWQVAMVADRLVAVGLDEWETPAVWRMASDRTWHMDELPILDPLGAEEASAVAIEDLDGRAILAGSECSSGRCRIDVWVEQPAGEPDD